MNTFDVSKRCISTYEQFLKDREKAEKAKHDEKGEADLVKKSMSGEVEGKKGYATLDEGIIGGDKYKLFNKYALEYYLKTDYEVDVDDIIEQIYHEIKESTVKILKHHGFLQHESEMKLLENKSK